MVRAILQKMKPAELRKYISAHNKVVRQYIGVEIKQARAAYSEKLKVRRREMKAAQQIDSKGKKKAELIELIMKEPTLVKQIKLDKESKPEEKKPEEKKPEPKKKKILPEITDEMILKSAQKLVDQLKKIDSEYSQSNLKKLFGGMSGNAERKKASKVLKDWSNSWNKLKVGKVSKVDSLFEKIKKNMGEASKNFPSETIEEEQKKKKTLPKPPTKKVSVERLNRIRQKIRDLGKAEVEKKKKLADEIEKVAKDLKIKKARAGKKPAKKEKPPANEAKRIPKMLAIIQEGQKKGVPVKGLETQLRELENQYDLSDFLGAGKAPEPKAKPKPQEKKSAPTAEDIKKAALAAAEEETDDDDETPDPPISAVPKRLHKVWKNYMEERVGDYYSSSDQQDEIDDFKTAEKDYLSNEKIRSDTSVSASKQASARNANARTRKSMDDEFKTDSDIKKLYKEFAPRLFKKYEEFEKDLKKRKEADRKAEAAAAKEEIKFQEELARKKQKEDEAEEKRIAKFQESERKRKEAAKKTASKEIKSSKN